MKLLIPIATLCLLVDSAADLAEIKTIATQGIVSAQINLGIMYETFQSAPQEYVEVVKRYRKADKQC